MSDYEFDNYEFNEDDSDNRFEVGYNQQQHMYNEDEISLQKYGLTDIPIKNVYTMSKLKLLEGDAKFFLRQLINCYRFLKFHEKLNLTPYHFKTVYDSLPLMTFSTKKSPLGLLLAIYIYDKTTIINMDKFYQITKLKKNIEANYIIPIVYIYKVRAGDIVRYTKLFHNIIK